MEVASNDDPNFALRRMEMEVAVQVCVGVWVGGCVCGWVGMFINKLFESGCSKSLR